MKSIVFPALSVAVALSACSVREASIAMPSSLASASERLELTGMGGGRSGSFEVAGTRGTFRRNADRVGVLDPLLVGHGGSGEFEIEAAAGQPRLSGRCAYREGQVNVGPFSVTPRRLSFQCDFSRAGRPINARLHLEDPAGFFGSVDGRSARRGQLEYDGLRVEVRSIHRDQQGGLPTPTPLGYMFSIDGQEIGAVDVNGPNKTIYAPRVGPLREAVLASSLALAVFWDPANI
jgi:hypothetical protein